MGKFICDIHGEIRECERFFRKLFCPQCVIDKLGLKEVKTVKGPKVNTSADTWNTLR